MIYNTYINPRRHNGVERGGDQIDSYPLDFFVFNFFAFWPITKSFGTTVLCMLTHPLTEMKWRHNWWRYHYKTHNLCVDSEISIFC